jgi:hypothetical protein
MISRRLQREIYNFGFSGNGKMELGVCVLSPVLHTSAAFYHL